MSMSTYEVVARALARLQQDGPAPSLEELAREAGQSPAHFQRVFAAWAGVSPQRFRQFISRQRARQALALSGSLLEASLAAGLSGPGRLHDLVVTCEAVTPAQWRAGGEDVTIRYGFAETPFGPAIAGITDLGLCHLAFVAQDEARARQELADSWPNATLVPDKTLAQDYLDRAFGIPPAQPRPLHLFLRGSNFQLRVWQALLTIPSGQVVTYAHLANFIAAPKAARALGSAVAANHIGFLIPCHRVILGSGLFGQYRWGSVRKTAMIGWEAARREPEEEEKILHEC